MDKVQSIIENEINIDKAKPSAKIKLEVWRNYDKFSWAKEFVYGIDADYRLVKSSKVSLFLNGDGEANIIRANGLDNFSKSKDYKGKLKLSSYEESKDNAQFDILIANPPYSVNSFKSTIKYGEESFELFEKLTDNSSEIECLFIERMKQLLKIGGYAGIILPSSILTNTGIYTTTREILLKYFKIIAITEFGSNTFMATTTNTVTLFLERRENTDYKQIQNSINNFFEKPKDITILGIEKAISEYVNFVFEGITIVDYISFINKMPTVAFSELEIYKDYKIWFNNLTEIKKLKESKAFKEKSTIQQNEHLEELFYNKVFAIEKDKLLYFFLTYTQKTVVTKVGEKQAEKNFLGYEFSKRRGHEGIRMLPGGTKLYDEDDQFNFEKANSYVYNAFLGYYIDIDESLRNNISVINTYNFIDFSVVQFEKTINIKTNLKLNFKTKYPCEKLNSKVDIIKGITYGKNDQVYSETDNVVLTADNITLSNKLDVVKKVFLKDKLLLNENAKLKDEDIFMCFSSGSRSHVGKSAYINSDTNYYAGGFMGILRKKPNIANENGILMKYLHIILSSSKVRNYFSELGNGTNIKNLNDSIGNVKIPIPPIYIQEKIVSEVDKMEKLQDENINNLSSLQTQLLLPKYFSFETERIDKIAVMVQRGKSAKYGTSNIQIIKSGQARGYTEFDFSIKHYVSDRFISDERNLKKGDILINSTGVGTAGRVTLFDLDGEFVADSHITILRLDKNKALPKYVLYALANIGFKNIESMANGQSGQIELSLSTINAIRIPLPPLKKQIEIVSQIELIENEIKVLQTEIENVEERKESILKKYL